MKTSCDMWRRAASTGQRYKPPSWSKDTPPPAKPRRRKRRKRQRSLPEWAKQFREKLLTRQTKQELLFASWLEVHRIAYKPQAFVKGFFVDFLLRGRLAVEIDGSHHELQREKDAKRTAKIESRRIKLLRFPNYLIKPENELRVIGVVRRSLKR